MGRPQSCQKLAADSFPRAHRTAGGSVETDASLDTLLGPGLWARSMRHLAGRPPLTAGHVIRSVPELAGSRGTSGVLWFEGDLWLLSGVVWIFLICNCGYGCGGWWSGGVGGVVQS